MNPAVCLYNELWLIDYALGKLPTAKAEALERHLPWCPRCRRWAAEWAALVPSAGEAALGNVLAREGAGCGEGGAAAPEAYARSAVVPPPGPSGRLHRRLRARVALRRWRRTLSARRHVAAAAFGMLAAALLVPGLFALTREPASALPDGSIIREMNIVLHPHTVQYAVSASAARSLGAPMRADAAPPRSAAKSGQAGEGGACDLRGYAWVNRPTNELLLLVEGSPPDRDRDYQAWFVDQDGPGRRSGGVLSWNGGKAHLYYRGAEVRGAENIAISLEPKGGSDMPSAPDSLLVSVKGK